MNNTDFNNWMPLVSKRHTREPLASGIVSVTKNGMIAIAKDTVKRSFGCLPVKVRVFVSKNGSSVRLVPSLDAADKNGFAVRYGKHTARTSIQGIRKLTLGKSSRVPAEGGDGYIDFSINR